MVDKFTQELSHHYLLGCINKYWNSLLEEEVGAVYFFFEVSIAAFWAMCFKYVSELHRFESGSVEERKVDRED